MFVTGGSVSRHSLVMVGGSTSSVLLMPPERRSWRFRAVSDMSKLVLFGGSGDKLLPMGARLKGPRLPEGCEPFVRPACGEALRWLDCDSLRRGDVSEPREPRRLSLCREEKLSLQLLSLCCEPQLSLSETSTEGGGC